MQGCDDFTFNLQTLRARNNYTNVIIGSKYVFELKHHHVLTNVI